MAKSRLHPASARRAAVVVTAMVVAACQTSGTNSSDGPSVAELRNVPPLEGQRRPGVLPGDVEPRPFPAQAGIRIFLVYENDSIIGRYVVHGKSTYSVGANGDVSRTDHFETATAAIRSKARNGRAATVNFVIDAVPLREEIRGPGKTLKSLRLHELSSADIRTSDGPASLADSVITVLNEYYRDGALVYPVDLSRQTFIGDASLVPNDVNSAIIALETVLIPAVERGNVHGDQDSYLRYLRNQLADIKRSRQDYDFESDVRVRGTWVLNGREYLELNGPYSFAIDLSGNSPAIINGEQTSLIDPSTGTYRLFIGTIDQPGGAGSNEAFSIRMDFMVPLDTPVTAQPANGRPQPVRAGAESVALAVAREGPGDLLVGRLSFDATGKAGGLAAAVGAVRCEGTWQYFDGPKASWSMTCSDGVAAAGNFTRVGPKDGNGKGVDTDGKPVRLTFGES